MRNEIKIEIETADGQIVWKHFRFPTWKLNGAWAKRFLAFVERVLRQGRSSIKDEPKPKEKPFSQNPVMRAEAGSILSNLGVKKKDIKRILNRVGPCQDTEEMVRKCLQKT